MPKKGYYPPALKAHNDKRHAAYLAKRAERKHRDSTIISIPVGTLTGGYYIEDFSRRQISTATAKNMSAWMTAYHSYLSGNTEAMAEFRKKHGRYYTVQGERFYWVTDSKSLKKIHNTGEAYELVFYGEREFIT